MQSGYIEREVEEDIMPDYRKSYGTFKIDSKWRVGSSELGKNESRELRVGSSEEEHAGNRALVVGSSEEEKAGNSSSDSPLATPHSPSGEASSPNSQLPTSNSLSGDSLITVEGPLSEDKYPEPIPGPITRIIRYYAPFDKCDREEDYKTAWEEFERRKK